MHRDAKGALTLASVSTTTLTLRPSRGSRMLALMPAPFALGVRYVILAALAIGCSSEPAAPGQGAGGGAPSASSQGGGSSQGGATGQSVTTGQGGAGGQGASDAGGSGPGDACPDIAIGDGVPESCSGEPGMMPHAELTECPSDSAEYWPARIFEVPVSAGDCLAMRADNMGSPLGADLFGAVVTPEGTSILFDEELPCSVPNPEGYACPSGAVTVTAAGKAYVMVGAWEGKGCAAGRATPFTLSVSLNGVAVDVKAAPVCSGDLQAIIP